MTKTKNVARWLLLTIAMCFVPLLVVVINIASDMKDQGTTIVIVASLLALVTAKISAERAIDERAHLIQSGSMTEKDGMALMGMAWASFIAFPIAAYLLLIQYLKEICTPDTYFIGWEYSAEAGGYGYSISIVLIIAIIATLVFGTMGAEAIRPELIWVKSSNGSIKN